MSEVEIILNINGKVSLSNDCLKRGKRGYAMIDFIQYKHWLEGPLGPTDQLPFSAHSLLRTTAKLVTLCLLSYFRPHPNRLFLRQLSIDVLS